MADDEENEDGLTTWQLLRAENRTLRSKLNNWETQMTPKTIMDNLIDTMLAHYAAVTPGASQVTLTKRYYAIDERQKRVPLDDAAEQKIEALWLNRLETTTTTFRKQVATLSLHPKQLKDDRPLPILILGNGTQLPIVRREDHLTQSHLLKNDPGLLGVVLDKAGAAEWMTRGNLAIATDTSVWPGHVGLEKLTALWLGRVPRDPPEATLVVDAKLVRQFLSQMLLHDQARCHLTCSGNKNMYAYLCLTANDGQQTDLARLPLGSVVA